MLARTAQNLVEDLNESSDLLKANPKLAGSRFMALMQGISERQVVVEDGEAGVSADDVGEGAKFVNRARGGGSLDWAGDFLGQPTGAGSARSEGVVRPGSSSQISEMDPAYVPGMTVGSGTGFRRATVSPYQPSAGVDTMQSAWERQFQDQEAVVQSEQSSAVSDTTRQRRKSVHFDQVLGDGVPTDLNEAMASRTSVPGAFSAWAEGGLEDDFDEETFMAYNGEIRQARSPRIGVGDMEAWGDLQRDWEDFQRAEPTQAGLRGMGRGDQVERYLFQGGNPYTAGMVDVDSFGRESPTYKV